MDDYPQLVKEACARLLAPGGALLVSGVSEHNPMTISWCQFGRLWHKPMVNVFVRKSRYSHALIMRDMAFTTAFPLDGAMDDQLAFCGAKSGRDINKLDALGLIHLPGRSGGVGSIEGRFIHFECKVLATADIAGDFSYVSPEVCERFYEEGKFTKFGSKASHTTFFGEVLAAYRT